MTEHFDIGRIIGITLVDRSKASWEWLPRKRKKILGIFNSKHWHPSGFYRYGCYEECYESGCWDSTPFTQDELEKSGYLVDSEKNVWNRPYVTIYLESDCKVTKRFDNTEEASLWVEKLKEDSGKKFEIVHQ
jgi:hypothetical protein